MFSDRPEILPHDRNLAEVYNASPKILGAPPPPKKFGPRTCEISVNFVPLQTKFDREYLRNEATYPKSENLRTRTLPHAFDEKVR